MIFASIDGEKAFSVSVMCRVLGVSRSGFYAFRRRAESHHTREDRRLGVLCIEAHQRSHRQCYGAPRVLRELKTAGVRISGKRVARLLREQNIRVRPRRRWTTTTDSALVTAPNLLDRNFTPSAQNGSWAGDVTYLSTPDGFICLAVVIDLFSRFVVGWAVSALNDRHLALKAIEMATRRRRP